MHKICEGCSKLNGDGCPYGIVPSAYIRRDECAFNPKVKETAKEKIRVGQQKQRKRK